MAYYPLYASPISNPRSLHALIAALDPIHEALWDASEEGGGGGAPAWGDPTELTISGGIVIVTSGVYHYLVDTEGDAASDDLTRITGLTNGDEVIIRPAHDDRSVVIKNGTYLKIGPDFTMNSIYDTMKLLCIGGDVCQQIARSSPA